MPSKKPKDAWRVRWLQNDKPTHKDTKYEADARNKESKLLERGALGVSVYPISYDLSDFAPRKAGTCF